MGDYKTISIPASVHITVPADFDITDEDALADEVVEEHGRYITIDHRDLGYENAEDLG